MADINASNVTPIADRQTAPACKFTITAQLRGFPITIEGEGRAGDLKIIVDRLFDLGAEPPNDHRDHSEPTKAAGVPTCPTHNAPMNASQKPGTYFCSKKNDDGSYCRHKA